MPPPRAGRKLPGIGISVPQRQTIRELQNIQEYIAAAIEIIRNGTMAERDD